jgi:hypothetical protein
MRGGVGRSNSLGRKALPWLVAVVWLLGTLCAFWFFESRLPRPAWCSGFGYARPEAVNVNSRGFSS